MHSVHETNKARYLTINVCPEGSLKGPEGSFKGDYKKFDKKKEKS
jgi:hypothetical protein